MKVALVHDYLNEFGGAERVLKALSELYPDAPIYTAFYVKNSHAYERFKDKKILTSWVHNIPFFAKRLHSPLRFLAPLIWGSFYFKDYDVVIGSAGWYVTKGFKKGHNTVEICYCHTPPRWLYGYKTSIEWQRFWPVRLYAKAIGAFMRMYDKEASEHVDFFVANSEEVKRRIKMFYDRDATVIYPPVSLPTTDYGLQKTKPAVDGRQKSVVRDYYLIVSRIVGGKGLDIAVKAAIEGGFKLKVVGAPAGYYTEFKKLHKQKAENVEFLGYVSDEELVKLYSGAKAFLATATDEDFGITPVEAMMCGTPVIAFFGGGYKETVVDGKTGVFFQEHTPKALLDAIIKFEKLSIKSENCLKQAKKFSKERFQKEIGEFVKAHIKVKVPEVVQEENKDARNN